MQEWIQEFVSKIRKENSSARIIIVIDEIDNALRKVLEKSNVLDIFLDSSVEVQDIVDIIGERIPLTARGKNFFGVCPFHDDSNPSLSVSREKQIYTCMDI